MLTKKVPTMNIDLDKVSGFIDSDVVILHEEYYQKQHGRFHSVRVAQIKCTGNRYYINKLQPTGGKVCIGNATDQNLINVYANNLREDGYIFLTPDINIYKLISDE